MNTITRPGDMARKSMETLVMRIAAQFAAVLMGIVIARSLGPASKGIFTYAIVTLAMMLTVSSGASAAIARQYGRLNISSGIVYSAMMRFFWCVIVPLSAGLAALAFFKHQPLLFFPAAAFPAAYLNQTSLSYSLVDGNVRFSNLQGLLTGVAMLVVMTVACGIFHLPMEKALYFWVAVHLGVTFWSIRRIQEYRRGNRGTPEERNQAFVRQILFGLRVTVNQWLARVNFQIDVYIVLFLLGPKQLGLYSIAIGVGELMWHLSRPMATAATKRVARGTPEEAAAMTTACVRHAFFNVGLACIALFFIGPPLLRLVYGPQFAASGLVLQLLLPGIVAYCMVPFFNQYFNLQLGKPFIRTGVMCVSIIVCGVFTYLTAPHIGIIAGAIGTSISYVFSLVACATYFCRQTKTPFYKLFAFDANDLRHYVVLLQWITSSPRLLLERKAP